MANEVNLTVIQVTKQVVYVDGMSLVNLISDSPRLEAKMRNIYIYILHIQWVKQVLTEL